MFTLFLFLLPSSLGTEQEQESPGKGPMAGECLGDCLCRDISICWDLLNWPFFLSLFLSFTTILPHISMTVFVSLYFASPDLCVSFLFPFFLFVSLNLCLFIFLISFLPLILVSLPSLLSCSLPLPVPTIIPLFFLSLSCSHFSLLQNYIFPWPLFISLFCSPVDLSVSIIVFLLFLFSFSFTFPVSFPILLSLVSSYTSLPIFSFHVSSLHPYSLF